MAHMNGSRPRSRSPLKSEVRRRVSVAPEFFLFIFLEDLSLDARPSACFKLASYVVCFCQAKCGSSARDLMEGGSTSQIGYAFDDLICMPGHINFGVHDVDLLSRFTRAISLQTPIASSPMDTVTEATMAIAMALEGGIGIIHSKMTIEKQSAQVQSVKRYEQGFISRPLCITPNMSCGELLKLRETCGFSGFPVTVTGRLNSKLLGLVTRRDADFSSESTKMSDARLHFWEGFGCLAETNFSEKAGWIYDKQF